MLLNTVAVTGLLLSAPLRNAEELLLAVWGGRRLCHHEGQINKSVARVRICQI